MPTANNTRALWPLLVIVVAVLAAGGCSTSNTKSGLSLVDEQGNHSAGWIAAHPRFALPDGSICVSCHGSVTSAADSGGISGVSCFLASRNGQGCHAGGPGTAPHPLDNTWVADSPAVQPHGNNAKAAPGVSSGFAYCQACHGTGTNFAGGSSGRSCYPCHEASAPHPSQWRTGDTYVHTTADTGNASVCAFCHLGGANSPIGPPSPPAPAGTPPGCFNNTLCHGENPPPHPVGAAWVTTPPAAQPHGNSAKATPSGPAGFAFCRVCHGTTDGNYDGGSAQVSCLNNSACHGSGVQSPHASQWFQGDTYVHITTDPGNASECAFCHFNEPNAGNHSPTPPPAGSTPGCFNGTLCHGASISQHPEGWFVRPPGPQPHGQSAKAASSGSPGFAVCRICHGTPDGNFNGGAAKFSCLIVACHGGGGLSPHAAQWLPDDPYRHITTDPGNASECAFCHYGESSGGNHLPTPPPVGSTPGCTNNTLCHGG